uniref:Ig-like domain-containing protein n=1 Tax=Maylandia zebra TaxID=106582 RepID=A0A3P9D991_9CICH
MLRNRYLLKECLILGGVRCEELTADKEDTSSLEGSAVTLSYRYSKQAYESDEFYWYRQHAGKAPELLIAHVGSKNLMKRESSRVSFKVVDDRRQITISSAAVSDSAVYYCAVRPTHLTKLATRRNSPQNVSTRSSMHHVIERLWHAGPVGGLDSMWSFASNPAFHLRQSYPERSKASV